MKIETPQILWHNSSEGNGKPAPLYSVSILPCYSSTDNKSAHVLATAGNTNEVHIWHISFPNANNNSDDTDDTDDNKRQTKRPKLILSPTTSSSIALITSITRHQRSVNSVSFSPYGTHLATAGDGGSLIIHSVPFQYRLNNNNKYQHCQSQPSKSIEQFWKKELQSEKDLHIKILNTHSEDIMDLSWSMDEKRVIVGSLDHSVFVFEEQQQQQAQVNYNNLNHNNGNQSMMVDTTTTNSASGSEWNCVWRNTKEHTHYVQGVAYDPLGVYLASQGSDRSVRVWQRKRSGKNKGNSSSSSSSALGKKKVVLAPMDGNVDGGNKQSVIQSVGSNVSTSNNTSSLDNNHSNINANNNNSSNTINNNVMNVDITNIAIQNELLMGKFEVGKAKMLKFRTIKDESSFAPENLNTNSTSTNDEGNINNWSNNNNPKSIPSAAGKARYLFADESTVESFFRRLAWTNDGAFLITPASLWHSNENDMNRSTSADDDTMITNQDNQQQQSLTTSPSFATYLFARHQYDQPFKVLSGLEKPSIVIRPNPVFFKLPSNYTEPDLKENMKQTNHSNNTRSLWSSSTSNHELVENTPYRSIFAVLTADSVLIYDTHHSRPLCIARGLHYAGLTDCSWTADGRNLVVCSTDGYISILSFGDGELGEVYSDNIRSIIVSTASMSATYTGTTATTSSSRMATDSNSIHRDRKDTSMAVSNKQSLKNDAKPTTFPSNCAQTLPPCEPGQSSTIYAPPSKKAKVEREKKRVVPTLLSSASSSSNNNNVVEQNVGENDDNSENMRMNSEITTTTTTTTTGEGKGMETAEEVVGAVTNLSINNNVNQIHSIC